MHIWCNTLCDRWRCYKGDSSNMSMNPSILYYNTMCADSITWPLWSNGEYKRWFGQLHKRDMHKEVDVASSPSIDGWIRLGLDTHYEREYGDKVVKLQTCVNKHLLCDSKWMKWVIKLAYTRETSILVPCLPGIHTILICNINQVSTHFGFRRPHMLCFHPQLYFNSSGEGAPRRCQWHKN